MSIVFHKDVEAFGVTEARADRQRLEELNIRSPDVSQMLKLKVDRQTMFYFKSKNMRSNFIAKYYNRRTKRYSFEKQQEELTLTN